MTNLNDYRAEQQPSLKPCPCCSGEARLDTYPDAPEFFAIVRCSQCDIKVVKDTEEEAIEAWNTRAERTCQLLRLENEDVCSFCGYAEEVDSAYIPNNYCPNCGAKVVEE